MTGIRLIGSDSNDFGISDVAALIERRHLLRLLGYVTDNKGLLALTFFFGTLGFGATFVYPWLIGRLIDGVIVPVSRPFSERLNLLLWLTAGGLLTPFVFTVAGYGRGHYNVLLGNRIVIALRRDLFSHLLTLSLRFYSKERTGTLVSRLLHEVHAVNNLLHTGFILLAIDIGQLLIAGLLLWTTSIPLTISVLLVLPFYLMTFYVFNGPLRRSSALVQQLYGRLAGNLQEQFAGVALTKAFAAEDREVTRTVADSEAHYELTARQSHIGHSVGACSEFFIHLATGITMGVAGYLALYDDVPLSAGQLTRFIGYAGILYGPINRLAQLNTVYQNSFASIRRVMRIFDIRPQVADCDNPIMTVPKNGDVEFDHVFFTYRSDHDEVRNGLDDEAAGEGSYNARPQLRDDDGWVLNGLSMKVAKGEKIALVGPSGSGKTTLISLIPRLYDVCQGSIRIDGVDVRHYALKTLRQSIGIVHQEPFLFSGTIRENIAYGKPDAGMNELIASAEAANAHEFIKLLHHGYDTVVGERGVLLSGGQKQRIAIARALLCDPRILLLDEVTSSLDAQSETLVVEALDRLMEGRTCFIIAHRLSTIRNADRIYALCNGRIVEAGQHEELLMKKGIYAHFFLQQFGNGGGVRTQ